MRVWIVKGENCKVSFGEVAWTCGVHATEAGAAKCLEDAVRECRENRPELVIYGNGESGYTGGDWDREYAIEAWEVEQ